MNDDSLLEVLHDVATAVRGALDGLDDWGEAGTRAGQYRSDLAADEAALSVLDRAGLGWMSEETGAQHTDRDLVAIIDPVDGSTNAGRGIPWFATSICVLDADGPRAALVVDQARDRRYSATRGGGAFVDGDPISPTASTDLGTSIIGLSGYPPHYLGWKQFRALGAAALDLCAVADGTLDAYLDCSPNAHGSWDYLGGMLVCQEAGAHVAEAFDRPLVETDHAARRTPIAAATPELLDQAIAARRSIEWPDDPPPPE
jgi:fructose-1,6-bisphosphatase/inositol monophosphatase family enzyme